MWFCRSTSARADGIAHGHALELALEFLAELTEQRAREHARPLVDALDGAGDAIGGLRDALEQMRGIRADRSVVVEDVVVLERFHLVQAPFTGDRT